MAEGRIVAAAALMLLVAPAPAARPIVPERWIGPVPCGEPAVDLFPRDRTTLALPGTEVGVRFFRGNGMYHVDEATVKVLRPGAGHSGEPVLAARAAGFAAGERTLSVTFAGVDADGRPLPAGRYPVVLVVRTLSAGWCPPRDLLRTAVVTTLDWRG